MLCDLLLKRSASETLAKLPTLNEVDVVHTLAIDQCDRLTNLFPQIESMDVRVGQVQGEIYSCRAEIGAELEDSLWILCDRKSQNGNDVAVGVEPYTSA